MPRRDAKRFPRGQPSMENSKAPSPAGSKFRRAGGIFLPRAVPKRGTMAERKRRRWLAKRAGSLLFVCRGRKAAGRGVRVPSRGSRKQQKKKRFCVSTKPLLWCAGRDSPAPLRTVRRTVRPGRGRKAAGRAVRVPSGDFRKRQKRRGSLFPWNLFFGAAEHSASELLRGDSIGTPTGSSSCLIPIGTRNSVSSFVYNYGEGKNLVSTWLNKPCPVWKRPFSIRKMFIPMMLRKPAVLHWSLCRIPFCQ